MILLAVAASGVGSYLTFDRQAGSYTFATSSSVTTGLTVQTPLYRLYGKLFFDYNGNGKQDRGEPDLSDVVVALDGKNATSTNSTGWYVIDKVPHGMNTIRPFPPKNFRYMCESAAEFRSTKEYYVISVGNDTRKDVGLMEGYLTLPFHRNATYTIDRYYDWDPSEQSYLWWDGRRASEESQGGTINHGAIDFGVRMGTPILAAAPGVVIDKRVSDGVKWIRIRHENDLVTSYEHISEDFVHVGQTLSRGERIALSGMSGTFYPHLDLNLRPLRDQGILIDPYAPAFGISEKNSGYLVVLGTGQNKWVSVPPDKNLNGLGYWSKRNDPRYSA